MPRAHVLYAGTYGGIRAEVGDIIDVDDAAFKAGADRDTLQAAPDGAEPTATAPEPEPTPPEPDAGEILDV